MERRPAELLHRHRLRPPAADPPRVPEVPPRESRERVLLYNLRGGQWDMQVGGQWEMQVGVADKDV